MQIYLSYRHLHYVCDRVVFVDFWRVHMGQFVYFDIDLWVWFRGGSTVGWSHAQISNLRDMTSF